MLFPKKKIIHFFAVLCTSLVMGVAFCHTLELPNKINLPAADYLTVQQNYKGWAKLGILHVTALFLAAMLVWLGRKAHWEFTCFIVSLGCLIVMLVVFFLLTFPANHATANWTRLPENWLELRNQWEYSHAFNSILAFCAMCSLTLAAFVDE